jgi:hypothetical protein
MILPKPIADLVDAHNKFGSITFSDSLAENAVVFDSGKTYRGKKEITQWTATFNNEHKTFLKPVEIATINNRIILKVKVLGIFKGSPKTRTYNLGINEDKITSLIAE